MGLPRDIESRWTAGVVLKRDPLSTVERGRFASGSGDVEAVLRRIDEVPWWSVAVARHLFARERRALAIAGELGIAPPLLFTGRGALIRGWIDGLPLHIAKPHGERAFFRSAKASLRKLHRAGICHNDLAKEQNWLRGRDGRAYLTDFQLAARFPRRSFLFRIAAYEDLRHLLKHKRRYAPDALTAAETAAKAPPKLPEHLQVTGRLPRSASGEVRREILELVAMNQVDLIEPLIANEDERGLVARIVADRRNLRDRFAF